MKEAGCWHISFGIESGNPDILRLIKKNISLEAAEKVIGWCADLGIRTKGFFIVGPPRRDRARAWTRRSATPCGCRLDDVVVTLNTPIPGSQQYAEADQFGTLDTTDWSQFNYWRPVFVPRGLDRATLVARHKEFYRRFYLRPRVLLRYFLSLFSRSGPRRLVVAPAVGPVSVSEEEGAGGIRGSAAPFLSF